MKNYTILFAAIMLLSFSACKKDKISVTTEKTYIQANHTPSGTYDGGWQLTLTPEGIADIIPSGDIIYRGTYKVTGDKIKVKSDGGNFEFKIITETALKEAKNGTILKLKTD